MMHDEALKEIFNSTNVVAGDLRRSLGVGSVRMLDSSPGHEDAGSLYATFRIRETTAAAAGVTTAGFYETLRALSSLDPQELIYVFPFSGPEEGFIAFFRKLDRALIGCLRVDRK